MTTLRSGGRGERAARRSPSPENLLELAKLEQWLEARPEIGGAHLARRLGLLSSTTRGGRRPPRPVRAARGPRADRQLLLLGRGDEQDGLLDASWQRANLVVRTIAVVDGRDPRARGAIETRLAKLPPALHGRVTGQAIAFQRVCGSAGRGAAAEPRARARRRVRDPVAPVPVAARGSARGRAQPGRGRVLLRLPRRREPPLSLATSVVPPIALGFALNATIHYFARFAAEARRLADEEAATGRALVGGRPARDDLAHSRCALAFAALATARSASCAGSGATAAAALGVPGCARSCCARRCAPSSTWSRSGTRSRSTSAKRRSARSPCCATSPPRSVGSSRSTAPCGSVPAGQPLLRSGDEGREMFLVIDGVLRGLDRHARRAARSWAASRAATWSARSASTRASTPRSSTWSSARASCASPSAASRASSALAAHRRRPVPQPVAHPRRPRRRDDRRVQ